MIKSSLFEIGDRHITALCARLKQPSTLTLYVKRARLSIKTLLVLALEVFLKSLQHSGSELLQRLKHSQMRSAMNEFARIDKSNSKDRSAFARRYKVCY